MGITYFCIHLFLTTDFIAHECNVSGWRDYLCLCLLCTMAIKETENLHLNIIYAKLIYFVLALLVF